jgi:hypothetical protein
MLGRHIRRHSAQFLTEIALATIPQSRLIRIKQALAEGAGTFGCLLDEVSVLAKRRLVAIDKVQADPAIILPLDQAEELFFPDGVAEAEAFLDLLSRMIAPAAEMRPRKMLVVVTMRSDRYELLQNEPHLAGIKRDLFDLPPIPQAEFKSVIEGPARRVVEAGGRLAINPALSERLIADAQGADALPLLGFTLERLYADYGSGGGLTVADYDRLGGVQGSIEEAIASALAEPTRLPAISVEKVRRGWPEQRDEPTGYIFSMISTCAPSGASRKQTRRPLALGGISSRIRTPLAFSLANVPV